MSVSRYHSQEIKTCPKQFDSMNKKRHRAYRPPKLYMARVLFLYVLVAALVGYSLWLLLKLLVRGG